MSFQCHCPSGLAWGRHPHFQTCTSSSLDPINSMSPTVWVQPCHTLSPCSQGHPLTVYFVTTSINNHNSQWDWWLIIAVITHLSVGDNFDRQLCCRYILYHSVHSDETRSNFRFEGGFSWFYLVMFDMPKQQISQFVYCHNLNVNLIVFTCLHPYPTGKGDIVLYCIVLYCIVLYCIVLYCIVLYCIVLYCIVLYCTLSFLTSWHL